MHEMDVYDNRAEYDGMIIREMDLVDFFKGTRPTEVTFHGSYFTEFMLSAARVVNVYGIAMRGADPPMVHALDEFITGGLQCLNP